MKSSPWLFAALLCSGCLFAATPEQEAKRDNLSEAYERLLNALGDQSLPLEKRQTAMRMLKQADKAAIPLLISRLSDGRTFNPSVEDPSGSADGPREKYSMTVGMACEDILYSIIGAGGKSGLVIENWKEWWRRNENKSLPEIIKESSQLKK